jgi:hypothetical protein
VVPWQAAARHTAASGGVLIDTPNSGLPGTTVSLSGVGFPRTDDSTSYTLALSFDSLAFASSPTLKIIPCTDGTFGFGTQCSPTAQAFQFQIPAGTTPGAHTFLFSVNDANGAPIDSASAQFTVTAPVLIDTPNSGLPGTTVSLSGVGFPRTDDSTSYTRTLSYDKLAFASPPIIQCTDSTFGFGTQCSPTATAFQFQIPASAAPGAHTFDFTVKNVDGALIDSASAPFTVTAVNTATPTATVPAATATSTAAAATSTNTAVPNAPTATNTNTPLPSAPTATNTAIPAKPSATATATPVKKFVAPFVVLVRPDFDRDVVAVALRDFSHATVKTEFAILIKSQGTTKTAFSVSHAGITNALGVYSYNVIIHFPAHTPGEANLTITVTDAGGTKTVTRTYRYQVSTR